jgi:hypothetical protein
MMNPEETFRYVAVAGDDGDLSGITLAELCTLAIRLSTLLNAAYYFNSIFRSENTRAERILMRVNAELQRREGPLNDR